jgi:predicted DNA-binding mobile mystery protein A
VTRRNCESPTKPIEEAHPTDSGATVHCVLRRVFAFRPRTQGPLAIQAKGVRVTRSDGANVQMKRSWQGAARRRLDQHLTGLGDRIGFPPQIGWIRMIRGALGMSSYELAGRLGVTGERVLQLERAEVGRTMPLATLDRVAAALRCRVCYVLVPEEPLERMVIRQALERAACELADSSPAARDGLDREGQAARTGVVTTRVMTRALQLVDRRGLWRVPRPGELRESG